MSRQYTEDDTRMIRLQEGDARAFDELVAEYQSMLIGFFVRKTRDRQLAEDLAQETFLRVYQKAWDYLPTGQFKGWMFRIGRNLLIDNHRRRSHDCLVKAVQAKDDDRNEALMARMVDALPAAAEIAVQKEISLAVEEILPELPDEQRDTFTMFLFEGLSLPEVADAMDSTVPTTKSRLRLAREKLRNHMKSRGFQDPNEPTD